MRTQYTFRVGKADREFEIEIPSEAVVEYLVHYGLKQRFADVVASPKFAAGDEAAEKIEDSIALLESGVIPTGGGVRGSGADPVLTELSRSLAQKLGDCRVSVRDACARDEDKCRVLLISYAQRKGKTTRKQWAALWTHLLAKAEARLAEDDEDEDLDEILAA